LSKQSCSLSQQSLIALLAKDTFYKQRPPWSDRCYYSYFGLFREFERSNIDKDELRALQEVATELLSFDDKQLKTALNAGEIVEICSEDDKA